MSGSNTNPLALGGNFVFEGDTYTTQQYVSLESLLASRHRDGQRLVISISDILKSQSSENESDVVSEACASGAETLNETDWKAADERRSKLTILLEADQPTRKLVAEVAEALGRGISTIYRWRAKWLANGKITDLAPHHPSGGRGKARIDETSQAILEEVLRDFYLNAQRLKPAKVMKEIKLRCTRAKVPVPHMNTLRRRIAALSVRDKIRTREGKSAAKLFTPAPGTFPGADFPNAVWQIDHTPVDVCIVDDVYRRNIGRCWITVAIDVFSRCIVGYYLSIDSPNAASVGMCLVHAILPKEGWMAAHGLSGHWPIWGKPLKVHADNDKTFRCEMVTRAAKEHRIDLEWRPVRTPHWGGHIERLLGTFNQEIHTLPGTTFSNPHERGEYKPHKEAALTFAELETYITTYITGQYHCDFHTGIRRPPIKRYEAGLLGDGVQVGRGLPEPEKDPLRLRVDFLPFILRTVQSYGIQWDGISYYEPILDPWIHSKDPGGSRAKRKFFCRRDPRDVSFIWFLDPDKNTYQKIPYRNTEYPSINLWELLAAKRELTRQGRGEVNEALIFETYEQQKSLVAQASQATQSARKAAQKKKIYTKKLVAEQAQVDHTASQRPAEISKRSIPSALDEWQDDDVVVGFRSRLER